ncbi:MAG TPA: hypothetical protein VIJ14_09425 [Rhabdochlamydiaceae bacterium]
MSRSTKKPYYTDQQSSGKGSKEAKRQANRVLRNANKKACEEESEAETADGKAYRKESCSWNIRDWSSHSPKDKKAYRK